MNIQNYTIKILDKSIQNMKYIMKEIFTKCSIYNTSDCIPTFKSKTGEMMRNLMNVSNICNKYYISLNKIILKIPEILYKLLNFELETCEEIIASILYNKSLFEFSLNEDDEEFHNNINYFGLISIHFQCLKQIFEYFNDVLDMLFIIKRLTQIIHFQKTNQPNQIINTNTLGGSIISGNNGNILNSSMIINTNHNNPIQSTSNHSFFQHSGLIFFENSILFSEEKLKILYEKIDKVKLFYKDIINQYESHYDIEDTEILSIVSSINNIVECIDYLFLSQRQIISIDLINSSLNLYKTLNFISINKENQINKTRMFHFITTFHSDNINKYNLIFKYFHIQKRENLNISNEKNKLHEGVSFNPYSNNKKLSVSSINIKSIKFENSKYSEYLKYKLPSSEITWIKLFFNKKKFKSSMDFINLSPLSKLQFTYLNNNELENEKEKNKEYIILNSIIDNSNLSSSDEDDLLITTFISDMKGLYGNLKYKQNGFIYIFTTLSNYIILGIKLKEKNEYFKNLIKQALKSYEEKFSNLHIYDLLSFLIKID